MHPKKFTVTLIVRFLLNSSAMISNHFQMDSGIIEFQTLVLRQIDGQRYQLEPFRTLSILHHL